MQELSYTLDTLLRAMMVRKASDLHLAVGNHPIVRVNGSLRPMTEYEKLKPSGIESLLMAILDADRVDRLRSGRNLDISYSLGDEGRFRGNLLWQRETLGAVFRLIPPRPFTIEELGLPPVLYDLAQKPRGLILVTGPTGSGKSTTQAAMIDYINTSRDTHIVTIEDPIEYLHTDKRSLIRQRELGSDVLTFVDALKYVLRQDPDVILVGEMRDLETIALAVTAAETGHLVFGTLHTSSAASTVDRIIDVFPPGQQNQIRLQLASTLEAVLCQTLLPRAAGGGRVCAMEIMLGSHAVRSLIREGKTHQLPTVLDSNVKQGMQSLNMALKGLVQSGLVSLDDAMERCSSPDTFSRLLGVAVHAAR